MTLLLLMVLEQSTCLEEHQEELSDSSSYDWLYGSYFDRNGYAKSSAMAHSFQALYTWDHNHTPKSRNSSNSQQGIIGGVNGTSLVNESGGGQLTPGTGSVGNHTRCTIFDRKNHNHTISGQTGSIQLSGLTPDRTKTHAYVIHNLYGGKLDVIWFNWSNYCYCFSLKCHWFFLYTRRVVGM